MRKVQLKEEQDYPLSVVEPLLDLCVDGRPLCVPSENQPSQRRVEMYRSKFVGAVAVGEVLYEFVPKFVSEQVDSDARRTIYGSIRSYKQRSVDPQVRNIFNGQAEFYDLTSLALFFLSDFSVHGLYTTDIKSFTTQGTWAIDWPRTVNTTAPIIQSGVPAYPNVVMRRHTTDRSTLLTQLHSAILTDISEWMRATGFSDITGFTPFNIGGPSIQSLGSVEMLVRSINAELELQFVTWKQTILVAMRNYLQAKENAAGEGSPIWYGTMNFNLIWEAACGSAFNAKSRAWESAQRNPVWTYSTNETLDIHSSTPSRFILDGVVQSDSGFIIIDAKYYSPKFGSTTVTSAPGIEDVVKQFAYQSSISDWAKSNGRTIIGNAFILPKLLKRGSVLESRGQVTFPELDLSKEDRFVPISIIEADPIAVLDMYVRGREFDNSVLAALLCQPQAALS